jgi:hypothetical protein
VAVEQEVLAGVLGCQSAHKVDPFWSAPLRVDRLMERHLPFCRAFEGWKPMVRHRTHSIEFKRQVVQDYLAGETLHALAMRYDLSRNLIRIWIQKFEAGAFDDEAIAAEMIQA